MDGLSFGQRIVSFRAKKHMLQKELAEKIGILPTALSRYENDVREPDVITITKLAEALGVTGDELLGRSAADYPTYAQTEDEIKLLNDYRALNKEGKEYMRQTMEMIVVNDKYKKYNSVSDMEASTKTR